MTKRPSGRFFFGSKLCRASAYLPVFAPPAPREAGFSAPRLLRRHKGRAGRLFGLAEPKRSAPRSQCLPCPNPVMNIFANISCIRSAFWGKADSHWFMAVEALWRWLREDVTYHHCHASADDLTRRVADFEVRLNRDPFVIADRLWVKDHLDPEEEKLRFSK